jgi:hypothetical protein
MYAATQASGNSVHILRIKHQSQTCDVGMGRNRKCVSALFARFSLLSGAAVEENLVGCEVVSFYE